MVPGANVEAVRRFVHKLAIAADLPAMPEPFEKLLAQRKLSASKRNPGKSAAQKGKARKSSGSKGK